MSSDQLHDLLVCPCCRGELRWKSDSAECGRCAAQFPIREGIPVLLAAGSATDAHKQRQAAAHDLGDDAGFECLRPLTAPRFYGELMQEKISVALHGLEGPEERSTAMISCAGSGMDAEMLARRGYLVVAVDISHGACIRILDRARRTGLSILPVVGDAENLPIADRSVDLAFVHDGLHHLENYFGGVDEMLRVSGADISISEPTRALATRISVCVGPSVAVEDSGNRVVRMRPREVVARLEAAGAAPLPSTRFVMYYRHRPGPVVRFLSRKRLGPLGLRTLRALNRIIGPLGNKMVVRGTYRRYQLREG